MWNDDRELSAIRYPFEELRAALDQSGEPVVIQTTPGPWLANILHELAESCARPVAVIAPSNRAARQLEEALQGIRAGYTRASTLLLPPMEVSPYAETSADRQLAMNRAAVAARAGALQAGDVLIASATAWANRLPPRALIDELTITLEVNEELDIKALRAALIAGGYSAVGLVEDHGSFSVRGDLIDIYAPDEELPVRVELYGDMVESIRTFDPVSQRSSGDRLSFTVRPISELILSEQTRAHAREVLTALGSELKVPSRHVGEVLRDIQDGVRFFGIEAVLPAFYEAPETLRERIPGNTIVVAVEPEDGRAAIETWLQARQREFERELDDGRLVYPVSGFFADAGEVLPPTLSDRTYVVTRQLGALEGEREAFAFPYVTNDDVVRMRKQVADTPRFFDELKELLESWREFYGRVQIVAANRPGAQRLAHRLRAIGYEPRMREDGLDLSPRAPRWQELEVTIAPLREGFRAPGRGVAVLTDYELFGRTQRRTSRESMEDAVAISSFQDLDIDDLVVHIDFGIGQYKGLQRIKVADDVETEFLVLLYADDQKLYVPIHRLGRVQRYVGSASFTKLDKLGGTSWERTKTRVKKQIEAIAQELLQLYAERAARTGFKYSEPDESYFDFEASFPFEETPHQQRAIDELLADMVSEKPMDRLLCGDVGFGKTEVAIRAAYKAVLDGRQVAVLVPTTVLADQHLASFRSRLSGTAARVEMVSRFRSAQQIREVLRDLKEGKVDVIIGTHRLLGADVQFQNLGLLIVDEEQRFGVKHKERIKQMRTEVDVLTMTATPIPRTLEMAMLGIRDLSVIMTPPPGRMEVSTHLARFKAATVKEGIERELERGGQVFFVHNRVSTIHNVAEEIRRIVPAARVIVGHAQMSAEELEKIMHAFINREYDVLVATTIIESGIDIPNANTMFINRADTFGLSQLYQLRGRVGRSSQKAYCYLLVNEPHRLTMEARRRLEVIQQHTELGSGFQIAQHDLDMRGAGSLLGSDQSGHIESIGFELFSELLEEAIRDIKGEAHDADYEPEVRVPVATFIPDDYVDDLKQRLTFYKRFSMSRDEGEVAEVFAELEDRYGSAPEPVQTLREVIMIKVGLKALRAERLEATSAYVAVDLRDDTPLEPARVMELIQQSGGAYSFKPPMRVVARLTGGESKELVAGCARVLRELRELL